MDAIALYGSSDSDENVEVGHPSEFSELHVPPHGTCQPALPSALDLLPSTSDAIAPTDDADHQGRARSFPHIEGNYATHVFIDVRLPQHCRAPIETFLNLIKKHIPALQPVQDDLGVGAVPVAATFNTSSTTVAAAGITAATAPSASAILAQPVYHLSLSRTAPIRHLQIDSLLAALRKCLKKLDAFTVHLGTNCEILLNDEKTRSFLTLSAISSPLNNSSPTINTNTIDDTSPLLRAINAISAVFILHGLPGFYENPRPHVSIAWLLGDQEAELTSVLAQPGVAPALKASQRVKWTVDPEAVVCRIGQKRYSVWERPVPGLPR